jgi:propanediol dehydratase small subunit
MPARYPLFETHADQLKTPTGVPFEEITVEALLADKIGMQDLRVTRQALDMQAAIAEQAGRPQLADNLRRAAELVNVPEGDILAIYDLLRPGRSDRARLRQVALDLETRYAATCCAQLIRDAADAYVETSATEVKPG